MKDTASTFKRKVRPKKGDEEQEVSSHWD